MYESEKDFFNKWLKRKLCNCAIHRIESGSTSPGFPDCYAQCINTFIELKNNPVYKIDREQFKVDWRPGQQAFALQELACKTFVTGLGTAYAKCSWTFMAVSDGVILVKHATFFKDDKVMDPWIFRWTDDTDYTLITFLKVHGFVVTVNDATSTADYRIRYIRTLLHAWGLSVEPDFTYEDWFDDGEEAWNTTDLASDLWQLEDIAWSIYKNEVLNGKHK